MELGSLANGWVESYLAALLSQGLSQEHLQSPGHARSDDVNAEKTIFANYYVQQILRLSEQGLWQAWSKASSAKNPEGRDVRLEHLTWRVWWMKRNQQRVRAERQRLKAEKEDLDSDEVSSEDEDEDDEDEEEDVATGRAGAQGPKLGGVLAQRDSLDLGSRPPPEEPTDRAADGLEQRVDGLYILMVSLHGLVSGKKMELGRDPDTGGQVKYVVELARALVRHPAVHRVDLLTRQIKDPSVDAVYGEPEETLLKTAGSLGGAYIVRLPCGPVQQYVRKELLWPHIREFADNAVSYAKGMLNSLSEAREPCELYNVHGHYADAGEVAVYISLTMGVDMAFTGHSLGRNKLDHLLCSGKLSSAEIEQTYKISRRIEAEERALDNAMMVVTSTKQEVAQQWGQYDGYDRKLERAMRTRRRAGYRCPTMRVIPPGLDFDNLKVELPQKDAEHSPGVGEAPRAERVLSAEMGEPRMWQEVARFLQNPRKPVILAMSRPDAKKNVATLIRAFGNSRVLRELANLVLIMGNRESIDAMAGGSKTILEQVLKLIDLYDLYGSVAYPKKHHQSEISDIYRLPAATKGVFTNVALQEPFGLTLIEAAAHGVPIVATKNGGPEDIIATLDNGILVDPTDEQEIANALLKILCDRNVWNKYSENGVNNIMAYTWPAHCSLYLQLIEKEKRLLKTLKRITTHTGSWDNTKFRKALGNVQEHRESVAVNGDGCDAALISPKVAIDDTVFGWDPKARRAEEEKDVGPPRVAVRKRVCVFTLDTQKDSVQALELLASAIKIGIKKRNPQAGPVGFGLASMMSYDQTCSMLEDAKINLQDIDFMILNSGSDLFVWWGQEDMSSYEPYEVHIDDGWDKKHVLNRFDKPPKQEKSTKWALKETGPFHVITGAESSTVPGMDGVKAKDQILSKLRKRGIRTQMTFQVDKASDGSPVTPLLHITPFRASRSLALRFLFHRLGIELTNVTIVNFATGMISEEKSRRVKFAVSDMDGLLGGTQKVVIVPTKAAEVVDETDSKWSSRMWWDLDGEDGCDWYGSRVVLMSEPKTKVDPEVRRHIGIDGN
eukprot:evm.model.scf_603.4 EVM.evm.TU.scf_603.4   scf_603:21080-24472(-)